MRTDDARTTTQNPQIESDADETTCEECDATIEIGEETVTEAVVRHFKAKHGLGEEDG